MGRGPLLPEGLAGMGVAPSSRRGWRVHGRGPLLLEGGVRLVSARDTMLVLCPPPARFFFPFWFPFVACKPSS
eukprot:NODE_7464_length_400_cov_20.589744_g5800_i0.p2 GENE.NODE_7464_length_400_cov_20.589744_g5800_i0~~NODE_7464_length_400_cov_20.589744_g5800_i0.p2  ORF type:complete len:80 (+),score=24.04 NODE_7464_length_400_cov_20.589744_g5800_i0:24-242(+)